MLLGVRNVALEQVLGDDIRVVGCQAGRPANKVRARGGLTITDVKVDGAEWLAGLREGSGQVGSEGSEHYES